MPASIWTRSSLTEQGFTGWVPWSDHRTAFNAVPLEAGGVYVVVRTDAEPPTFLEQSAGGHFKGEDPTVPLTALTANWVDQASVVYIGKADHGRLRERLKEYASFGRGNRIGHKGGRLIWQLADLPVSRVAALVTGLIRDDLIEAPPGYLGAADEYEPTVG